MCRHAAPAPAAAPGMVGLRLRSPCWEDTWRRVASGVELAEPGLGKQGVLIPVRWSFSACS